MRLRFLILCAAALFLSGCASTMPGQPEKDSFDQVVAAILHKEVKITSRQMDGAAGGCRGIVPVVAEAQQPGLGGILRLLLGEKIETVGGCVLSITLVGDVLPIEVICPPKVAPKCKAKLMTQPIRIYVTDIPIGVAGGPGQLLVGRISDL